jgi:hypothetical protein
MYKTEMQIREAIEAAAAARFTGTGLETPEDVLLDCLEGSNDVYGTLPAPSPEDMHRSLEKTQRVLCSLVVRLVKAKVLSIDDTVLLFPQG